MLQAATKIDKTKVSKTNGSLMKVESIAECSKRAFCNTFDLHYAVIGRKSQFSVFFLSGRLRQVLLYFNATYIVVRFYNIFTIPQGVFYLFKQYFKRVVLLAKLASLQSGPLQIIKHTKQYYI